MTDRPGFGAEKPGTTAEEHGTTAEKSAGDADRRGTDADIEHGNATADTTTDMTDDTPTNDDRNARTGDDRTEHSDDDRSARTDGRSDRSDPEPDGSDGARPDRLSANRLRGILDRFALVALVVLAVVAGWSFYGHVGTAIRTWIDPAYQSLALAAFNLAVLLVALAGLAHQLRRLRAEGGDGAAADSNE